MALTEELELDVTGALSQIDSLGTALDQVTTTFKVDLADALDVLQNVQLDVDASAVPSEIDSAVNAADAIVSVEADVSSVEGEIASVDASPIVIPVEVDTAGAEQSLDAVTASASDATSSLGGLGSVAGGATTSLSGITSGATGLAGSLGKAVPGAAAVTAGITVLAGATDTFFNSAIAAESATQRFGNTFGSFTADIQNVNVGNLTTDLGVLNRSLGSSTSESKQAASSIGELGISFGATQQEAALTAEQITALAARAVALNPQLGSVGQATEQLSKALLTGRAKALAPFQLGLSKTAIDAKAAEIALADGGREVTAFDKQTAGAALATAKLGDSLKQDIAKGAANPVLQLKAISAEFSKLVTEIGKPLISPVLDIIRSFQPIAQSATKLVGGLVTALLPVAQGIITAIQPLITGVFGALAGVVKSLQPVFEGLGKVVGALAPVFEFLLIPIRLIGKGIEALSPVFTILGDTLSLVADGLTLLLSPLTAATDALGLNSGAADTNADAMKNAAGETLTMATASDTLAATLGPTGVAFGKFVQTSTGFGKANLSGELQKMGVSTDVLQGQLSKGDAGLKEFTASAIESGRVVLRNADGTRISADGVRNYTGNLNALIGANENSVTTGRPLIDAFRETAISAEQGAAAQIAAITATQGLSASQVAGLPAQAQYVTGNASMVSQLQVLQAEVALADQALFTQQASLTGNAAAFVNLAGSIAAGDITQANAAERLRVIGLNAEQAKVFLDATKGAVDSFVQAAVATVPTASDVFAKLGTSASPAAGFTLAQDLKTVETQATAFSANLDLLGSQGFPNLQAQAAAAGPAATQALVDAIKAGGPKVALANEEAAAKTAAATKAAGDRVAEILRGNTVVQSDAAAAGAKAVGGAFAQNLDFAGVTKTEIDAVGPTITAANERIAADAKTAGNKTGVDYVGGIGAGVQGGTPGAVEAVRQMVKDLDAAARKQAEARSPSRLFAELGADISAGVAVGISDNAGAVVAEAEAIVAAAAAASFGAVSNLGSVQVGASLAAGAVGGATGANGGGMVVGPITVEINVTGSMTEAQARAAGQAAGDGLISQLEARRIEVAARTI